MRGLPDYQGRIGIVTGASSGIGAELARTLAGRGMRVALVSRRSERLEALAAEIAAVGGLASVHPADVGDPAAVESTARAIVARWRRIDLLANCAGYVRRVLFLDQETEDIERLMRTNYLGTVYWIKQVLPYMRARREGWIVNVSSFSGKFALPDEAAYSATKAAVSALSRALGYELGPMGIHVMCVHPALVRTEIFTPAALARLPKSARGSFIDPPAFVSRTLRALERGRTDVTVPGRFGWLHMLANLLPGTLGRAIARSKLRALRDAAL